MLIDSRSEDAVNQLLASASDALHGRFNLPPARRTRIAALLARCAIETHFEADFARLCANHPPRGHVSTRAKLICLWASAGDRKHVENLTWAWSELSIACHQQAYELSPTYGEVEHLVGRAAAIVRHD